MTDNIIYYRMYNPAFLGASIPAVFWMTLFLCAGVRDDYSHTHNMVSELGKLGSSTQYYFTAGLVACALLSILFLWKAYSICRQAGLPVIPVVVLFAYSFSIAGAGVFPYPTALHGVLGSPSAIMIVSPVLALIFWRNRRIPYLKVFAFIALVCFLMGFLVFFPEYFSELFGLKQRFFHFGWTIWFGYLGISMNTVRL